MEITLISEVNVVDSAVGGEGAFKEAMDRTKETVFDIDDSIRNIDTNSMADLLNIQYEMAVFSMQQELLVKSSTKLAQSVDQVAKSQ